MFALHFDEWGQDRGGAEFANVSGKDAGEQRAGDLLRYFGAEMPLDEASDRLVPIGRTGGGKILEFLGAGRFFAVGCRALSLKSDDLSMASRSDGTIILIPSGIGVSLPSMSR